MHSIFQYIFIGLHILIGIHLVFPFLLYIVHCFKVKDNYSIEGDRLEEVDYAIIVTAYQQTDLLPLVVDSILKLNYSNYLVYIVADQCDISELNFESQNVILLRPEEELASNTKSHFYAIHRFKRAHDRLTIIDSDNLVHPDYLNELNKVFNYGYDAVQGVREAKNLNTRYACLDAAGDIYYRFTDRQLLFDAGSSASLSGSGMAFSTTLYRSCLEHLEISGAGFDKILQYAIVERGERIAFSDRSLVYDEKTSKSDQLVNQRARWINTWFKFFKLGVKLFFKSFRNLNMNQFLFSLMLLRPPLFILVILSLICLTIDIFFSPFMFWGLLFCGISFFYVAFKSLSFFKADARIYDSLYSAPKFLFYQVLALFKAKRANKISVATRHDQSSNIDDLKFPK